MFRLPSQSTHSAFEGSLTAGWRVREESGLLAVCTFITMCVGIMVVLGVCVSATAAGIYSISIGGLLMTIGLVLRVCRKYEGDLGVELDPAGSEHELEHQRMHSERGGVSVEFACVYPLGLLCLASLIMFRGHVSGAAVALCGVGVAALIAGFALVAEHFRPADPAEGNAGEPNGSEPSQARFAGQRGSSAVEFAFVYPLVFLSMGGLFGLGQAFYSYNSLQSAMRSAARYGSLAPYDLPNGNDWKAAVRNMAVYGDPEPGPNAQTLVPGLTTANVQATAYIPEGEPTMVTVAVTSYEFDLVFLKFDVSQPVVTFPFLGRALIP
jgi:hypothetical protein